MLIDKNQEQKLRAAILYLNMQELKNICVHYNLAHKGDKIELIERIITYTTTGKITAEKQIPAISKAQPKMNYPLAAQTLILAGSFKNDLKTRMFLKSLIGQHFAYTAYGIDWIKQQWMQETPPTYAQFAAYWQSEYLARKNDKAPLKPQWAYLNFLDRYQKEYPTASKVQAIAAWNIERQLHVTKVFTMLGI